MGGKIIGVVKDFHFRSLHSEISPLTILFSKDKCDYLLLNIAAGDLSNTISHLEESWSTLVPAFPFEFQFLDEHIDNQYKADQRIEKIINSFTLLAFLIACLGLFGLAAYTAEQRTKEIGIRKVLGSSVISIIMLLSKEFTEWVIVANIIAWPASYYVMSKWLEGFAYRTELDWWIFLLSGGVALSLSLLTVTYQAVKAALANPVESLRSE
jgi:putative ABC transport system permease protein